MKVKKKFVTAAAVALLLAAPVVSWDLSSQIKNETVASGFLFENSPGNRAERALNENKTCQKVNDLAKGSRAPWWCTVKFKDHDGSCRSYKHCVVYRYEEQKTKDHGVRIKNSQGRTNEGKAKCNKNATARITCKAKTKTSSMQVKWWGYDGNNKHYEYGWKPMNTGWIG